MVVVLLPMILSVIALQHVPSSFAAVVSPSPLNKCCQCIKLLRRCLAGPTVDLTGTEDTRVFHKGAMEHEMQSKVCGFGPPKGFSDRVLKKALGKEFHCYLLHYFSLVRNLNKNGERSPVSSMRTTRMEAG